MKKKDLKKLKREDIQTKLEEMKKELMKYNAQISTGTPPENPGRVKTVKKTIARLTMMLKNEMEVKQKSNARN